jgi:hypothetical protein
MRVKKRTSIVLVTTEAEVIAYYDCCFAFDHVLRGFIRSEITLFDYRTRIRNIESGELCFDELHEDYASFNQVRTYFNAIGIYGMKT